MQLEILREPGRGAPRALDVLLVHGSYCAAWVWQPHVMPFLAERGYTVHALSFRGHGGSGLGGPLSNVSVADYVADLAAAVDRIGRPVAVVAHSLGGAVVQSALSSGARFAGVALLASIPPTGMLVPSQTMFWRRPRLWSELSRIMYSGVADADPEILRDGLFDNRISAEAFARLSRRFSNESARAILDVMGPYALGTMGLRDCPVLVLGGGRDWFISEWDIRQTAAWYGTPAVILPELSHAIMLDPSWQDAAIAVSDWLDGLTP